MDPLITKDKIATFLEKYKYAILILCVGIVLMLLPESTEDGKISSETNQESPAQSVQEQLEQILSQIHGVGKVSVLLTEQEGAVTEYLFDEDITENADSTSSRKSAVIISGTEREEAGVVLQVIPPIYLGAVIVCQGGDLPSVQLAVVQAVSNATGLSSDRITVLKMK